MAKKFRVYDKETGNFIADGTAFELSQRFGLDSNGLRNAAVAGYTLAGAYKVVDLADLDSEEPAGYVGHADVVAKWDAFCEPIRKKFGIPVYKANPEVRG